MHLVRDRAQVELDCVTTTHVRCLGLSLAECLLHHGERLRVAAHPALGVFEESRRPAADGQWHRGAAVASERPRRRDQLLVRHEAVSDGSLALGHKLLRHKLLRLGVQAGVGLLGGVPLPAVVGLDDARAGARVPSGGTHSTGCGKGRGQLWGNAVEREGCGKGGREKERARALTGLCLASAAPYTSCGWS